MLLAVFANHLKTVSFNVAPPHYDMIYRIMSYYGKRNRKRLVRMDMPSILCTMRRAGIYEMDIGNIEDCFKKMKEKIKPKKTKPQTKQILEFAID